jgi:hypothetical protein
MISCFLCDIILIDWKTQVFVPGTFRMPWMFSVLRNDKFL